MAKLMLSKPQFFLDHSLEICSINLLNRKWQSSDYKLSSEFGKIPSYSLTAKLRSSFQDSLDLFSNYDRDIETTIHIVVQCSNYLNFEKISNIKHSSMNLNVETVDEKFLLGSNDISEKENGLMIDTTIEYVLNTERCKAPLLWIHLNK